MYIAVVLAFNIIFVDGRVFCQDGNSSSWQPLGYSCPVTCTTIHTAVDRLRISDYENMLSQKFKNRLNISTMDVTTTGPQIKGNIFYGRKAYTLEPHIKKPIKLYNTYHRLLNNENFVDTLKKDAGYLTVDVNLTCSKMAAKDLKIKNLCSRKLYTRPDVVEKFTKFLNRYADPKFPFNEEMSGTILQKLETNLNLRHGVLDFKNILSYLREELRLHKENSRNDRTIELKSTNCMTIWLPGCYCRIGFVENQGQCVKPEDCGVNSAFNMYLERIILS